MYCVSQNTVFFLTSKQNKTTKTNNKQTKNAPTHTIVIHSCKTRKTYLHLLEHVIHTNSGVLFISPLKQFTSLVLSSRLPPENCGKGMAGCGERETERESKREQEE